MMRADSEIALQIDPPPPPPPQAAERFRVGADGEIIPLEGAAAGGGGGGMATVGQPPLPPFFAPTIPSEVVTISLAFFIMIAVIIIGWPIARALGRRMDRQGVATPRVADDQAAQLHRIEQAVETMAVEVERISEGQRFVTRLLAERPLGEAAAAAPALAARGVSGRPSDARDEHR